MSERIRREMELPFRETLPKIPGIEQMYDNPEQAKTIYITLYWIQEIVVGFGICPPLIGALNNYKIEGDVWKYDWTKVLQEILDIQLLSEILKQQPNQQDTEAERRTIETPLSPSAIFAWLNGVYETLASNDQSNRTLTSMIVLDQNTRNEEVDEALAMAKLLLYKELVSELKNNSNLAETRIYKILDKLRSTGLVGDSTVITAVSYTHLTLPTIYSV